MYSHQKWSRRKPEDRAKIFECLGAQLLQRAGSMRQKLLNAEGKFEIVENIVGRRHTRQGGLRLEVEWMKEGWNLKIMHAYGAGGGGFELSWGIAEVVVVLAYRETIFIIKL